LLGQAAMTAGSGKIVTAYAALFVYILFLLGMAYPSNRLDNIAFTRLRGIEKQVGWNNEKGRGFSVHSFMLEKSRTDYWVNLRRYNWTLYFLILMFAGFTVLTMT